MSDTLAADSGEVGRKDVARASAPASAEPVTGHEYDGIQEHDNRLPRWWLMTLYGAIVFAFGYWLYFHTFDIGLTPPERYALDVEEFDEQKAARLAQLASANTDEALTQLVSDAAMVERGRAVYTTSCLACHGDRGQGVVGPNLTDEYWLHGHQPTDTMRTIREGFLQKGMPSWGAVLGEDKIRDVTVFLITLRGTHATGGRGPEGAPAS